MSTKKMRLFFSAVINLLRFPRSNRMSNTNAIESHLKSASVYQSSAGQYVLGRKIAFKPLSKDRDGRLLIDANNPHRAHVKKSLPLTYKAPLYVQDQGHPLSPDEILSKNPVFDPQELPYMSREEVLTRTGTELPDSQLLNALHRYVAQRVMNSDLLDRFTKEEKNTFFTKFMDETALLALGISVEEWIKEMADDGDAYESYMEPSDSAIENILREEDDFLISSEEEELADEKAEERVLEDSQEYNQ